MFSTMINKVTKGALALLATSTIFVLASCGGGGGAALPVPQGTTKPVAGTADLSGQLVQAGGDRVVSAAGSGLPGVFVTLIDTLTGGKVGTDVTDNLGKFEFKGVPSGDNYLVKLEFTTTQDLDGDGRLDQIELFFPVSLADQAVTQLLEQIGVTDSNGDGSLDALEVELHLTDDNGRIETSHSQHRRGEGETRIDSDNDGSFDDESGFDDSDSDGIEDASSPDDSSSSNGNATELEVRGNIEAMDSSSITVGGVTFDLSAGTEWKNNGTYVAQSFFSVGMFVKIEGFPNANGGWTAHEVETESSISGGSGSDDNSGDDSMDDDSSDDNGSDDSVDDDSSDDNSGSDDSVDDDSSDDDSSDDSSDENGGSEREVRGLIEAITADSITVGGVTFALNGGTEWEVNDLPAGPGDFAVGMFVKIDGFGDGNGGWIAHEVETDN